MRIISGIFKGRTLQAPEGRTTRPTADRARQTLFNVLEHASWGPDLRRTRIIDLFAGSGALGLEALSRGGAFALFVETDEAARGAIRANIEALGLFGITRLHRRSAVDLGAKPANLGAPFDLAFLDPPYGQALVGPTLAGLTAGGWIAPGAMAVAEISADEETPETPGFTLLDDRTIGAARFLCLRYGPA
jgi:16S rRNA (guanine966-N2)-methyltransferase